MRQRHESKAKGFGLLMLAQRVFLVLGIKMRTTGFVERAVFLSAESAESAWKIAKAPVPVIYREAL